MIDAAPELQEACRTLHRMINVNGHAPGCAKAQAIRQRFPDVFWQKKPVFRSKVERVRLSALKRASPKTLHEVAQIWGTHLEAARSYLDRLSMLQLIRITSGPVPGSLQVEVRTKDDEYGDPDYCPECAELSNRLRDDSPAAP